MEKVVFVCGALRSGSTLTHLMLNNHPNIKHPGEFDFMFDLITDQGEFPSIEAYQEWLSSHRIFNSKSLVIDNELAFPGLIHSFISQLSQAGSVLALNIHRGFDRIPYLFPGAKFIHLIRDPRDVSRSSIGMGWDGNVYHGVGHWIETERSWYRLNKKILPEQYIEIKYEELILSPEFWLKKMCDFVGVSYSNEMLKYAEVSTYSKPDPSLVYQWKKKLSDREIQYIESRTHELIKQLDYELSGHEVISIGKLEKLWLNMTNKFFRLSFSCKRYGLYLYLIEFFSRRLNLHQIEKKARLKMNEINKLYLK